MSNPTNESERGRSPWLLLAAVLAAASGGLRLCTKATEDRRRTEAFESSQEINRTIQDLTEQARVAAPSGEPTLPAGIPTLDAEQSADVARQLFEQRCEEGEAELCNSAAQLIDDGGQAGDAQKKRARELWLRGCRLGHDVSCANLGTAYFNRGHGERDIDRALRLFRRSCTETATAGCYHLGVFYERGIGVDVDAEKARELIARACRAGYEGACKHGVAPKTG
jgi:TPR repeat protein